MITSNPPNMKSCDMWVSEFGTYPIPEEVLEGVRLTKYGYPDKRSPASYNKFMNWVRKQDEAYK